MKPRAICNVWIQDENDSEISKQARLASVSCWHDYCRSVGADHAIVLDPDPRVTGLNGSWSKIKAHPLLDEYEQLLIADIDIIISDLNDDIFSKYPDVDYAGMDEGSLGRRHCIDGCKAHGLNISDWKRSPSGHYLYFNDGMLLLRETCRPVLQRFKIEDAFDVQGTYVEQTYMNYLLNTSDLRFEELDRKYNTIDAMHTAEERFKGTFIHYAGCGWGNRDQRILDDFSRFRYDLIPREMILSESRIL